jgi:hypothetical protein
MPIPIDRARVQALLGEGAQLVEVLPRAEYEDEHLAEGAMTPGPIAPGRIEADRAPGRVPLRPVHASWRRMICLSSAVVTAAVRSPTPSLR